MADKSIEQLTEAEKVYTSDLFLLQQSGAAKKLSGNTLKNWLLELSESMGGIVSIDKVSTSGLVDTYRITYAKSAETTDFTVTNGAKGDKGDNMYIWIKYTGAQPTASSHAMGDIPDDWMGIYYGTASTAPTDWTEYAWFQIKGEKGDTGAPATLDNSSVTYMVSDNGTVVPSGSWQSTIPQVPQGKYLWTRTVNSFNSGSPVTSYSVSRMGIDGTGSVSSVNSQSPDSTGNIQLTAGDITTTDNQSVEAALSERTKTSVLPNNGGLIKTKFRCAKAEAIGTSGETRYYPMCKFPVNNNANYASALISGRIGGWGHDRMSYINALVWNRGTPGIALIDTAGLANQMSNVWGSCDLAIYVDSDNTATVYIVGTNYYVFDLDIKVFQTAASIVYDGTYVETTPAGTLAAKASTSTQRLELYGGKLYAAGKELATTSAATTSAAGLMSAADKTKLDELVATRKYGPYTVAASAWTADGDRYKTDIAIAGIGAADIANVYFAPASIDANELKPYCTTAANTVTIYAGSPPSEAVTIDKITVQRS